MLTRAPGLLKRYPLLSFFVLSYAITWPGWWLEAVGSAPFSYRLHVLVLAVLDVAIVALSGPKRLCRRPDRDSREDGQDVHPLGVRLYLGTCTGSDSM